MHNETEPFLVTSVPGYGPRIGLLVSQLQSARHYLLNASRDLPPELLDAAPGPAKNTIGAILAHLDAAENMFQRITFEKRGFDEKELERYEGPFDFTGGPRTHGRTLGEYHRDLFETRARTLEGLRSRDDAWLDEPRTFQKRPSNTFYYWFHYVMDEARHTGQLILVRKHLAAGADPGFEPYRPEAVTLTP